MKPVCRREFAKSCLGSAAASLLGSLVSSNVMFNEHVQAAAPVNKDLTPSWVRRGHLRWVWGLWEPLMFYKRAAFSSAYAVGNTEWTDKYYERMHSEEVISQLAEIGINCLSTHFFKGFGRVAEADEMEKAAELTELCHRYGIRVFGYHQFGTIAYETFLKEVPHAKEWIQVTKDGQLYLYSDRQYWRWTACPLNNEHAEYLKSVIREALLVAKMDGIEWDGTRYECHCESCQAAFRTYLEAQNPEPMGGFGLPSFDHVRIPPVENSRDPLYQELVKFRYKVLHDRLREYYLWVKELNPDAAVIMYPGWPAPESRPHDLDIIVDESHNSPHMDGQVLVTRVNECKRGNAAGRTVLNTSWRRTPSGDLRRPETQREVELELAECGAYGGQVISATWALRSAGPGDQAHFEQTHIREPFERYMGFFKRNERLYEVKNSLANVSIYNSFYGESAVQTVGEELLKSQVPFEYVFSDDPSRMAEFSLLILADQKCLSEQEIDAIAEFVRKGGALLATGETAKYDRRYQEREKWATRFPFRDERVCHLHEVPKTRQIIDAICHLLPGGLPVAIHAGPNVVVDVYELVSGSKTIHVINYDNENPVENVTVRMGEPFRGRTEAQYYSPDDGSEGATIQISSESVTIPRLQTYGVLLLHP